MTEPKPPQDAELDVVGHGLDRAMGLDQLSRPGRAPAREAVEPELPPLTKRFPSMRSERPETPKK